MTSNNFNYESLPSETIARFGKLTQLLCEHNKIHNLTRIIDHEQIRLRHYIDSLVAVDIINGLSSDDKNTIIDIGSGAGFPGLPLAMVLDNARITSVEATGKKIDFQKLAAAELCLKNFKPVYARAEELAHDSAFRSNYDFVVSRAVADLSILLEYCMPFVKPGGYFLAWKGRKADEEITTSQNALKLLYAEVTEIVPYTLSSSDDDMKIIVIKKLKSTSSQFPRPNSAIKKLPL